MTDLAPGAPGQGTPAPAGAAPASTAAAVAAAPPAPAGTPAGAPASSAAAALPPAPAPAATAAIPWLPGADETTAGYVQNKGWAEPSQVLESYRNLEKLFGADKAGNTVMLPKPDAPQTEVDAFYNRLGRPAEPAGYKIQVPDGSPREFADGAAAKMHELGLSQKQGEAIGLWYNEQAKAAMDGQAAQREQQFQADDVALKTEWGAAFTQKLADAQAAARGLGLQPADIDALQQVRGHKWTMDLLAKIGSKTGEADFVTGSSKAPFSAALTPGQAKARIAELKADKNWVARYLNKDAETVAEMTRLHSYLSPE